MRTTRRVFDGKAVVLAALFVPMLLVAGGGVALAGAPCQGPGAPTTGETRCLTAIAIPTIPDDALSHGGLRSYDISWVNPARHAYYLADRSSKGIDIINTRTNTFVTTITGFVGIVLTKTGTVDNNHSGPAGVTAHGRWLYAGDGDSTLKVIDLTKRPHPIVASISTGGSTRVDEMALTTDGTLLLAANNAEDPPFGTLFQANGDNATDATAIIAQILVDNAILPAGFGLSIEQPVWEPTTKRFYVSLPTIAENPAGCNYGQVPPPAPITCSGGLLVIDPTTVTGPSTTLGAFDATTHTGVVPLNACGPNGATVGPHADLLLGCTPGNLPSGTTTLVINAATLHFANIGGLTGSDEVWFDAGNVRYYTGSSRQPGGAVLGVIGPDSLLVETVPQSSGSHSVAADRRRNHIYVPQTAPVATVGPGGDTTTVGDGICGGTGKGCIGVFTKIGVDDEDQGD